MKTIFDPEINEFVTIISASEDKNCDVVSQCIYRQDNKCVNGMDACTQARKATVPEIKKYVNALQTAFKQKKSGD